MGVKNEKIHYLRDLFSEELRRRRRSSSSVALKSVIVRFVNKRKRKKLHKPVDFAVSVNSIRKNSLQGSSYRKYWTSCYARNYFSEAQYKISKRLHLGWNNSFIASTCEILQVNIYNINIINDMKNDNKDINNYHHQNLLATNTFLNLYDSKIAIKLI